ncbi:pickpocket protein 19-like isoform X1 [Homalodisca vitripennis]|uniref:pickpocket protein 19-like isoform X1 n=1 Tax=Homalodisca vitripennis TaxID=197043 RepID=UPI001EEC160F|nr:pickpocket protein 19-like isoform X1 [Homalodisca vitripennis]
MTRVLGSGYREETATRFSTTLKALTMVTNPKWDGGYTYFQSQNVTPFPIRNDDIIPFLKTVTHSIDDIIRICYWRGSHFNCSDIFRLQSTELGLCHSFNSYTSLQSSTDSKMNPPFRNEKGELVGFRSISEGRSSGIDLILHPKQSVGSGNIIVRAAVNSPRMYPPVSHLRPLQHQPEGMYRMEVQVEVTKAHSSLGAMDRNWLPCSLSGSDTMENCLLSCRSRHIWQHCGCLLYTHALLFNNDKVTICGVEQFQCLSRLTISLNYVELRYNSANSTGLVCDCKPVCSETMYTTNTQLMPRETTLFTFPYSVHFDVFYFSKWAMGYVVRGKITQSDVIVGLGGTSGLYLGASFISFIEVLVMVVKIFFSKA